MINLLPEEVDEENDQIWRYPWQSNIAMLLHDRYGITDWDKRNQAATDILNMIYDANWELIDYRKDKDKENEEMCQKCNENKFPEQANKPSLGGVRIYSEQLGRYINPEQEMKNRISNEDLPQQDPKSPPLYRSVCLLDERIQTLSESVFKLEDVLHPVLSQMEAPKPEDKTEVQSTGSSQVVRDIYQQCAILLSLEKKIKSLLVHLEV